MTELEQKITDLLNRHQLETGDEVAEITLERNEWTLYGEPTRRIVAVKVNCQLPKI